METIEYIHYLLVVGWYLAFIYFMAYLHVHYSIPYHSDYDKEYCDNIPSKLNPGGLSWLMYKKIVPEVFTTTILILIKRNVLKVKTKGEEHFLCLTTPDYQDLKLSNSQRYVVDFLYSMMNDKNEVNLNRIYNYCNSGEGSSDFLLNYQIWRRLILKESCQHNFFEDKFEYDKIKLFKYIGYILFVSNFILSFHLFIGYFILIPIYFLPLYFYKIYKRTIEANEEYHKWLAFKNYLANIKKFNYDEKEFDKYLIYATVLGVNQSFIAQFPENTNLKFVRKLDEAVNRCFIRATLYGSRSVKNLGIRHR